MKLSVLFTVIAVIAGLASLAGAQDITGLVPEFDMTVSPAAALGTEGMVGLVPDVDALAAKYAGCTLPLTGVDPGVFELVGLVPHVYMPVSPASTPASSEDTTMGLVPKL